MDDDVDIYGDLPSFNTNECATCKERAKEFTEKAAKLEKEIALWKGKCENFEQEKKIILTNTSSLMKTARAEIDRKDRTIIELRRELEDVKFRRGVWSKSKTNYQRNNHESKEKKVQKETKRYEKELSLVKVEIPSTNAESVFVKCEEVEEDPEQKWDPACQNFTVYGERLRKKLLEEQEAERVRKEEAKNAESKNVAASSNETGKLAGRKDGQVPCPSIEKNICGDIKVEETLKQEEESEPIPSDDPQSMQVAEKQLDPIESSVKLECESEKYFEELSEEGELSESSETRSENFELHRDENRRRDDRSEEFANRRYENDHKNDSIDRNLNFNHDLRRNLRYKARNRSLNSKAPGYSDKISHRQSKPTHHNRDLQNKRNYRSRSRTPDHKYHKTKGGYRAERHRDHFDKYEKRRDDRLTRDAHNFVDYNKKDDYDRRDRFDRKNDDRFFRDSRNDHDINYDSDRKRPGKSRSPGQASRSKSSSSRSSQNDRRRNERSRSRGRSNSKNKIESEKDRVDQSRKSRGRKIRSEDRVDNNFQTIQRVSESLGSNSTGNFKSTIPEESTIRNHHESREKSKSTSSHHNDGRLHERSKCHEALNIENEGESKGDSNGKKIEFGNREIVSKERDKVDPEMMEPMAEPSSSNLVENSKKTITTNLNSTSFEESGEKTNNNAQEAAVSSEKIVNPIDTRDKFILMLENDCEVGLSPITRREIEAIGSRSFREEKIENIEKFIQDYQEDANHCSLLGTDVPPEQEEENKSANSTSSIVDTLSMDVDDLEKKPDCKITEISENSENPRFQNLGINRESEEKSIDKKLRVDAIKEKDENSEVDLKVNKTCSTENSRDKKPLDKKLKKPVVDKEKEKADVIEKNKSQVAKTPETSADENKTVKVLDEMEKIATEEKKDIVAEKLESRHKQSEKMSTDKKTKRSTRSDKSHHNEKDRKTIEKMGEIDERKLKKEHKKSRKVDDDKKLTITESIDRRTENKESEEKSVDSKTEKKLESIKISERTDDNTIKRKCEDVSLDDKSKNVNLAKTRDIEDDKKLENVVVDSLPTNETIDKNSETVKLDKESKPVEIEEPKKTISQISPPLPFVPPIPPSPELPPLPPLPPSSPPDEKKVESSAENLVSTVEVEAKKLQTDKTTSKQTKHRPRIPCLPIVSIYSRKRRGMVLTDSTSSHTLVNSLKSAKGLEIVKESSVVEETPKTESAKVLTPVKTIETSISNETQSEKSTDGSKNPETERKMMTTKLDENSKSKNDNKIVSKTRNCSLDRDEPEINFPTTAASSNENIKSKDESATDSSSTIKNIVEEKAKDVDDKVREIEAEVNTINNSESKISETNSSSSKSLERATRSVLKTIASTTESTDSGSSNRKRPLSKEKENQSKPPKQTKIMIITRRRPVQLEDSSTVTTLVSSVSDDSSKDKKVKSSQKNIAAGRKRRVVES